ncbi:MAG: mechanosensitive ion channel [Bacteroidetes bacterium]|jgi:small-conductance mechanosensitive channel|nr:mechanosensitive ion channel [Bacteroidota bacterium]
MNQETTDSVEQFFSSIYLDYSDIIETVAVILALLVVHYTVIRIVRKRTDDDSIRYKWRKNLAYFLSFLGFILIGRIWFEGMGSIATFLGLLSAGLAIALRDPVTDMAGWLFLICHRYSVF